MGLLSEGIDGHSRVWRWGYGLKMEGVKLIDVCWRGGICRPGNFTKILFCKNFTKIGDFFLLSLLLLLCFWRTKDVKLQGFDPREMAQTHDTVAVLWGNIHLVGESVLPVLGLVLQRRHVVNPPSSWLFETVIILPAFPSFFFLSRPFSLLPPAPLPVCIADCLMRAGTATK